jgi:hypothetical protein
MGALLSVQVADEAQAVVAALHAALLFTAASHASAAGPRRRPAPPPPALYELPVAERARAVLQARVDNGDTICGVERRWLGAETEAVYVLERPSGGWDFAAARKCWGYRRGTAWTSGYIDAICEVVVSKTCVGAPQLSHSDSGYT